MITTAVKSFSLFLKTMVCLLMCTVSVVIVLSMNVVFIVAANSFFHNEDNFYHIPNTLNLQTRLENHKEEKVCRYRDKVVLFPSEVFRLVAGAGCYTYFKSSRLSFRHKIVKKAYKFENKSYVIDHANYSGEIFVFDYKNEEYLPLIKKSFRTTKDYFGMWLTCAKEADNCCLEYMNENNVYPTESHPCPAIWDAWSCFPPGQANTIVKMPCSSQVYTPGTSVCTLLSEKECFANGTWNQKTNYDVCLINPVYIRRHEFHVTMLYIATALSMPAIVIFFVFPKLRILRVILHRNLLIAIVIRNCLTIAAKKLVLIDSLIMKSNGVMSGNSVACRTLAFFEVVSKNAIFATMAVDAFYLHKLIVRPFANDPSFRVVYGFVLVPSFLPTIAWAIVKAINADENCWMTDSMGYQWISDGFRIAVLVFNTILLADILRVLFLKLKKNNSIHHKKAALRATLFLIPLFGLHMIIVANRNIISGNSCFEEDIFFYATYALEGLQGILVATMFCYFNAEVRKELSNVYRKWKLYFQQKFGFENSKNDVRRRTTAATYVQGYNNRENGNLSFNDANGIQESGSNAVRDWLTTSQRVK